MGATSCFFAALITVVFFGGYGRHVVSPVAFGWSFAALSFPAAFGFGWSYPFTGTMEGTEHWSAALALVEHPLEFMARRPDAIGLPDILAGACPQPPGNTLPGMVILLGLMLLGLVCLYLVRS